MNKIKVTSLAIVTLFLAACGKQGEAQESTSAVEAPVATAVAAESTAEVTTQFDRDQLLARFLKIGVVVSDLEPSEELPGLLELTTNQGTFFSNTDGSFFVPGTLFSLDDDGNYADVIASKRGPKIVSQLEAQRDNMIEFKADNEKHVVTVFTDITCGYCTKLHGNMQEYNDLGITVRYLAFPRAGDTGEVGTAMANIWCATDPKQAMNTSKLRGEFISQAEVTDKDCQAIVSEQYQLGRTIGVAGTPAIYTDAGLNIGGYLDPAVMLNRLEN